MRNIGKAIALVLVLTLTIGLGLNASAAEERKLTIWQAAFVSANELEKPESEWAFNQICRAFEAENPGVRIEAIYEKDQQMLQNKLKAAVLAGTAPDLINLYSGYLVTSLSDAFVDISALIPAEDKEKIIGWEAVSRNLELGAQVYGYPAAGAEMGILIYNKALVTKAGVDLEGEGAPKTAEEFVAAMRKIQAAGIQPIIGADSGYNAAFMFSFGSWWTQQSGTSRVTSNSLGTTKFADDEGYLSAIGMVNQMYKEGLINKDYATNPDPGGFFYAGQAAMLVTGNWEIQTAIDTLGEDNVGIYVAPNFKEGVAYPNATIGGVGQALCVTKTCKDPQLAVDFLSFFSNKQNVVRMCGVFSKLPQRTDVTAEDLGWVGRPIFEKLLKITSENLMPWNDNSMQSDVMNDYYKQSSLAVIGTITPLQSAEALDATAAQAASNAQ